MLRIAPVASRKRPVSRFEKCTQSHFLSGLERNHTHCAPSLWMDVGDGVETVDSASPIPLHVLA